MKSKKTPDRYQGLFTVVMKKTVLIYSVSLWAGVGLPP